jgi:hypothetical protein
MGLRILFDPVMERAVLYCSTSEVPFGSGFIGENAKDQAEAFVLWLEGESPRQLDSQQLSLRHSAFMREMRDAPDPVKWLEKLLCQEEDTRETPCPACPDGNRWTSEGPMGRCPVCKGTAVLQEAA